jgi:hypothetical protein
MRTHTKPLRLERYASTQFTSVCLSCVGIGLLLERTATGLETGSRGMDSVAGGLECARGLAKAGRVSAGAAPLQAVASLRPC